MGTVLVQLWHTIDDVGPALDRPCAYVSSLLACDSGSLVLYTFHLCHGGPYLAQHAQRTHRLDQVSFLKLYQLLYIARFQHWSSSGSKSYAAVIYSSISHINTWYNTHQARRFGPMMGQGLASVVNIGTTLRQRWSNLSSNLSLLDMWCTGPVMVLCSSTLDGHQLNASCVF